MTKPPIETHAEPGEGTVPDEAPEERSLAPIRRFRNAPLAAAGAGLLLLGLVVLYASKDSWRYFLRSAQPEDLGPVEKALPEGRLRHNTWVSLTARPLLESEGRSRGADPSPGCLTGPVRTTWLTLAAGTGDRLVLRTGESLKATQQIPKRARFTGRLLRLDALPETFTRYRQFLYRLTDCRTRPKECHRQLLVGTDLDRAALLAKLGAGEATIRSPDGHRVELRPLTPLFLLFRYRDLWEYTVEGASKAEATARVKALGVPWIWVESRREDQHFVIRAPKATAERLVKAQRRGAGYGISQRTASFLTSFGQLSRQGDSLVIRRVGPGFPEDYVVTPSAAPGDPPTLKAVRSEGLVRVPLTRFEKASYHGPRHLPADGFLLLEGVPPGRAWPAAVVAGLALALALIGLGLCLLGLRRPASR